MSLRVPPVPPAVCCLLVLMTTIRAGARPAAQLAHPYALEERQGAFARLPAGTVVRLRLGNGARAAGPVLRWAPYSVTLGPYLGYAETDTMVALASVDTLWVRGAGVRRGTLVGAVVGAAAGAAFGFAEGSLCRSERAVAKPCAQGVVAATAVGLALGGLGGALAGGEIPQWRRSFPRGRAAPLRFGGRVTLVAAGDSNGADPRALALARVDARRLVRLEFRDRPELFGRIETAGARRAVLARLDGVAESETVPFESLEAIWEQGTARRTVAPVGAVLGFGLAVFATTRAEGCGPDFDCTAAVIGNGILAGLAGWFAGLGGLIPKWRRRY